MDRLVEFYTAAFGAESIFEMEARPDHPRMVILDLGGGAALNVFETPPEEIIGDRRRQGGRGAIDHFALAVDSLATLEGCGSGWWPPAPRSARSSGSAASGRCSSATPTAWSSRSAATATEFAAGPAWPV